MAISPKTAEDDVDLPPKARRLRELGREVLGDAWQYRLAQEQQVNLKTVSRWATGLREVPDAIISHLEWMVVDLRKYRLRELLAEIDDMVEDGINLHVLAAQLTDVAIRYKPVKTVPKDKRYRLKRKPKPAADDAENPS